MLWHTVCATNSHARIAAANSSVLDAHCHNQFPVEAPETGSRGRCNEEWGKDGEKQESVGGERADERRNGVDPGVHQVPNSILSPILPPLLSLVWRQ